jgi:hypothetical protein
VRFSWQHHEARRGDSEVIPQLQVDLQRHQSAGGVLIAKCGFDVTKNTFAGLTRRRQLK